MKNGTRLLSDDPAVPAVDSRGRQRASGASASGAAGGAGGAGGGAPGLLSTGFCVRLSKVSPAPSAALRVPLTEPPDLRTGTDLRRRTEECSPIGAGERWRSGGCRTEEKSDAPPATWTETPGSAPTSFFPPASSSAASFISFFFFCGRDLTGEGGDTPL